MSADRQPYNKRHSGAFNREAQPSFNAVTEEDKKQASDRVQGLIQRTRKEGTLNLYELYLSRLKQKFGLERLELVSSRAAKETTLEELSDERQAEQEKGFNQSFGSATRYQGKRLGLSLVIRH